MDQLLREVAHSYTVVVMSDAVAAELGRFSVPVGELTERLPRRPGLYAWWAAPDVLPTLPGPPHPDGADRHLLYVGIATNLRTRILQNHLRRSGSSTLRRTLAGLLLDEEGYRTRRTSRVVLVDEDEARLTRWMADRLHVSWAEHPTPRDVETALITTLRPPLNVEHADGPARDVVVAARKAYYASSPPDPP